MIPYLLNDVHCICRGSTFILRLHSIFPYFGVVMYDIALKKRKIKVK